MYQDDVHRIAEKFLKQLEEGNSQYAEKQIEFEPLSITNLVLLKQPASPPFFYGFKPSGRPVFTHDIRIAKSFTATCPTVQQHVDQLKARGIEVETQLTIWREGRDA